MAYNKASEERKWRLWKEAEEKILREYDVSERIIEEIRIYDRAEFNSVEDLLDEVDSEALYRTLLTVERRTLLVLLLKMQGYATKEFL